MYQEDINELTALCTSTVEVCINNRTQITLSNCESNLIFDTIQKVLEEREASVGAFKNHM